jgi:hypothetical protein
MVGQLWIPLVCIKKDSGPLKVGHDDADVGPYALQNNIWLPCTHTFVQHSTIIITSINIKCETALNNIILYFLIKNRHVNILIFYYITLHNFNLIWCFVETVYWNKDCSVIHGQLQVLLSQLSTYIYFYTMQHSYYNLIIRSHLRLDYMKLYYIL